MMNKISLLAAMDIQSWRQRRPLSVAKNQELYQIYHFSFGHSSLGYLFVAKYFEGVTATAVSQLLAALFKATGLQFELIAKECLKWSGLCYAIVLGDYLLNDIAPLLPPNCTKIITEDPAAMILNPNCKRHVWSELQPLLKLKESL